MSLGLSLTVSVRPLLKWISDPFPFRCMNSIVSKSISNSHFAMSWSCFHVAMFSSAHSRPQFSLVMWPRPRGPLGRGMRSGPCSPGGDHRARPRSNITLGNEGLYLSIFRYRYPASLADKQIRFCNYVLLSQVSLTWAHLFFAVRTPT